MKGDKLHVVDDVQKLLWTSRQRLSTLGNAQVAFKVSSRSKILDVATVVDDELLGLAARVLGTVEGGETPLLGDDDLLASGELVTGAAKSLDDDGAVDVLATDGKNDLTNVDT